MIWCRIRFLSVQISFLLCPRLLSEALSQWTLKYDTTYVCALNGSMVFLNCTYSYPPGQTVTEAFWYINPLQQTNLNSEPGYSGRVQYFSDQGRHAVRLSDVRKTDERTFYFKFLTNGQSNPALRGDLGVKLSVTGKFVNYLILFKFCL